MSTPKNLTAEQKRGSENLLQAATLLRSLSTVLKDTISDGKLTLGDALRIWRIKDSLIAALDGIEELPAEIADLEPEELAEVLRLVPTFAEIAKTINSYRNATS